MLKVENISKSYNEVQALSNVDITLNKGEIVGLLGANGAGKSTLMKIMSGIIHPSQGRVLYMGAGIDESYKRRIGYLSEDNPLYEEMYVREYLDYVAGLYNVPTQNVARIIDALDLKIQGMRKIKSLSKGNRQRVGIAQALLHNPEILILDESTSGLDPNQRENLLNILRQISSERIIIFSTHILEEVKMLCNRFILIDKGSVVADEGVNNVTSIEEIFHNLTNEDCSR